MLAIGATVILTATWGLVSGLTEHHYLIALPVIGAVIVAALAATPARRTWFPALAAVLGFAVGYLGDIAAAAPNLWRHSYNSTLIADHATDVIRAVNDSHSIADWTFLTGTAATAARQSTRPTPVSRTGQR